MQIDQEIQEMEGKILLIDNKKFLYWIGIIGIYYIVYLSWFTYFLWQTRGWH